MQRAEMIRVFLFVACIAAVYVLAAESLIRMALRRPEAKVPRWKRLARAPALVLAVLGIGCFLYGWKVEPYWPQVTHATIQLAKLARAERPVRLVLISDVHSEPVPRLENRLPALIAAEHPDAIVFAGDAVNSAEGLPVFRRLMSDLVAIAPTFAVRGNWDLYYFNELDLYSGTGAVSLEGAGMPLHVRGATLWMAGMSVTREASLDRVLAGAPADAPRVLVFHYPDLMPEAKARGIELYLAGHTHGGQVALPWYGALVTLSKYGKRYERGLYQEDGTTLYVTRGIGMEGEGPPVRFCARPEITVLDLEAAP